MPRLPKNSFDAIVREHHAAVYRSALRIVADPTEAADVVQDVFVRALEGRVRFGADGNVRAPLCWLATKLACNAVRSRRRRHHHEERAMTARTGGSDTHLDPAHACAERDLHDVVQRLVQEMPGELRVPLQLRCQDDLTFAAIGTALRIPESTAHERVQRALQRLRTALSGRGFAVAAATVPGLVAGPAASMTPAGLEQRLLALGNPGVVASVGLMRRLAFAVLAAASAAALMVVAGPSGAGEDTTASALVAALADGSTVARATEPRPGIDADATSSRVPAEVGSPAVQDPAPTAVSVFTGSVRDAGAWPVAGARIVAVTAGGLKPFAVGETTTDAQGLFRLELKTPTEPVPSRVVRLQVVEDGRTLLETDELSVSREPTAPGLELSLPEALGTAMTRFELAVIVHGPGGQPLANVPVLVYEAGPPAPRPLQTEAEAQGTTGADGTARLGGRALGEKWLFVDGRAQDCCTELTGVRLDQPGSHRREIRLGAGKTLSGRIALVDGGVPEFANFWLEDETTRVYHSAAMAADGGVTFAGLGNGTYALHVRAPRTSPFVRTGLRAGPTPFAVSLKRNDDVRDVGDHLAELHGRLVDAVTGAAVTFTADQIGAYPVRPGESTLRLDGVEPPPPAQRKVDKVQREQFHVTGLAAGTWVLVVHVPGYAAAVTDFTLGAGEMKAGLAVPLSRGGEVLGRAVDAEGKPVAKAHVFGVGVGELADRVLEAWAAEAGDGGGRGRWPSLLSCSAWSAGDGRFALRDVPAGVAIRIVACVRGRPLGVLPARVLRPGEVVQDIELRLPQ